jgi:histone H2B
MGKEADERATAGKGKKKPQKRLLAGKTTQGKKKPIDGQKKRRKRKNYNSFTSAIYKITKQVHPDCTMSSKSMSIMNSFVNDILDRMLTEGTKLNRYTRKKTLGVRELQTVVRLMLPGELNRHAISEATKAVGKYSGGQMPDIDIAKGRGATGK